MYGLFLVNKPIEWTSYDVVRKLKNYTEEKKIGHGGTLDPFAEGVLVLGVGKEGTKQLGEILKNTLKIYRAVIKLGENSTTDDREGEIVKQKVENIPTLQEIIKIFNSFEGAIFQTPPNYSAVKVHGKAAYKRARAGETIILEPKKVFVKEIKVLEYVYPYITIEIISGSGFYVRSLARDVGKKLGTGGYISDLKRICIYNPTNQEIDFKIQDCLTIDDLEKDYIQCIARVFGIVQGVGFRMYVKKEAEKMEVVGYVKNCTNGSVEIVAEGNRKNLNEFIKQIKIGPPHARVENMNLRFQSSKNKYSNFNIE